MIRLAPEPLVFVDLETTGANFATGRIIEIGLVEVDQDGAREWSSLINPGMPVSSFITGLTGIDSSMVATAPRFEDLAPLILEKLRGRLFIAHNARFDYTFLKREFNRVGVEFRATSLCTVKLSRKLFPEFHRHSLDALVERHAIAVEDRHRALADAKVLWDLWQQWHATLPPATIQATVEAIVGRPELPPRIDPAIVDELPEAPGAYALIGENGAPLLVKRCANLRQQVLAHFAKNNRESATARNTYRVAWREAAGDLGARLGELQLSNKPKTPHDELCAWQLAKCAEGDFRPQLVFSEALDFAVAPELYGLYSSRREAIHALRKLAEAHRLCQTHTGLTAGKSGEACVGYRQRTCRGVCIGKEAVSLHSARLMAALAKYRLKEWPYAGPAALVERDDFGMREDFHVIDRWQHLGTVHDETALHTLLENRVDDPSGRFDPDVYRIVSKALASGKLRVIPLLARQT